MLLPCRPPARPKNLAQPSGVAAQFKDRCLFKGLVLLQSASFLSGVVGDFDDLTSNLGF